MTSKRHGLPAEAVLGEDTWSRQARRVLLLAGELNVPLDVEALLTCDVRDLLSLGWALEQALSKGGRWGKYLSPWRPPWRFSLVRGVPRSEK